MKTRIIILSLIAFFLSVSLIFAQKQQQTILIGVVDVEYIVRQMPEALDADAKLKEMQKNLQDTILKLQDALQKKADAYLKQKSMMPADKQQEQEQALQEENLRIQQLYNERLNEIQTKREEFLEPIRNKVRNAIQAVAKEENFSFVFDKGNPAVLFAEEKYDVTFKVLDKIKRGNK